MQYDQQEKANEKESKYLLLHVVCWEARLWSIFCIKRKTAKPAILEDDVTLELLSQAVVSRFFQHKSSPWWQSQKSDPPRQH